MAGETKIGIPIPETPWRREWVWAEPVQTSDGLRVYRLLNSSVFAPYVVGDLVTVRRSGKHLALAGLHERGGRTGHLIEFSVDVAQQAIDALTEEWAATGASVERLSSPYYSVAATEESRQRPTSTELGRLANEGTIAAFELIADPDDDAPQPNCRRPDSIRTIAH
jgi:hypothetical protein